jgi:hypothetical protein
MTISKIIGVFFFAFAATAVPETPRGISGAVSGSAATLTLSGAATGSTTTDANGNYVFSGLANGSYTVTPSQSGYTFTPPSASVTVLGTSTTGVNFTATAVPPTSYSISGSVSGSAATLTLSGPVAASTTSDANGNYTFSGLANGSYTVTASQSGYTFSPPSASVTLNGASITAVNFTATPVSYTISGSVSGSAATLTLSGAGTGSTTTSSTGTFTFSGLANGSYAVTPSQSGYTFTPPSASVTVNGASITGVNFTATAVTVSHSVTLNWAASTSSNIVGYNLYRGSTSGGPYTQIGFTGGTSYVDTNVSSGQTYYYVATAVDGSNNESADSNQAAAVIPIP